MASSKIKAWLATEGGVISASLVLLGVAALESSILPWAPYFVILMIAGLALPLWLRSYRFGKFRDAFKGHWPLILSAWAGAILIDQAFTGWIAERAWGVLGKAGDASFSVAAFIELLLGKIAERTGLPLAAAQIAFFLVALVWAPFGEELFYRGYAFGILKEKRGFMAASVASAFFFGFRHVLPVLYLLPDARWLPCVIWGSMAFCYGLINNWLYEKTGSLWPGVIGHFVVNAVSLALS